MDNKFSRNMGLILSYLLILIQTIIGLIYVPLLLYYLGQNEYGLYQLMGSIIAYFSIMDFGISNALISYYSKYLAVNEIEKIENLLFIAKRIYSIITIILIPIALFFYFNIENIFGNTLTLHEINESKAIFILLIINIIITLQTNLHTSVITANEKFIFLKLLSIIQTVAQPILVVVLLTISPYAFVVALSQTILNLLAGILKVIYFHSKLKISISFHYWDMNLIKGLLKLSLSVFVVSIVDQLFWKTNQFVLGIISGTGAVAVYSIASQIYMNYMPLSTTLQSVFLPHITKKLSTADKENVYINEIFVKIGRLQYIILLLVLTGFILYGKDFIILWAGKDYIVAYYIVLFILIPFTFDLTENTCYIIMQVKNIYSDRAIFYSIAAILNLVLSVTFAIKWGALGCGIATGICMFIINILVMNIYYKIKLKINVKYFFMNLCKLTIVILPAVFIGMVSKSIIPITDWKTLIVNCIIFTFFYIIFIYFGLNDYEKQLINKNLTKLFNNKSFKNDI